MVVLPWLSASFHEIAACKIILIKITLSKGLLVRVAHKSLLLISLESITDFDGKKVVLFSLEG